jgi:hypothetical protein
MSRDPIQFKTLSDDGEPVIYTIIPFDASHGCRMIPKLAPIASPIFSLFKGIDISSIMGAVKKVGLDTDLNETFADISKGEVSPDLQKAFLGITGGLADMASEALNEISQAIIQAGNDELIKSILKGVSRVFNKKAYMVGDDDHAFDVSYQANYGELIVIIMQVLKANYGKTLSRLKGTKKKR